MIRVLSNGNTPAAEVRISRQNRPWNDSEDNLESELQKQTCGKSLNLLKSAKKIPHTGDKESLDRCG